MYTYCYRWWFQMFLEFSPRSRRKNNQSDTLTHIFQICWNHINSVDFHVSYNFSPSPSFWKTTKTPHGKMAAWGTRQLDLERRVFVEKLRQKRTPNRRNHNLKKMRFLKGKSCTKLCFLKDRVIKQTNTLQRWSWYIFFVSKLETQVSRGFTKWNSWVPTVSILGIRTIISYVYLSLAYVQTI